MRRGKPNRFKCFFYLFAVLLSLLLCGCASNSRWAWQHSDKDSELQLLQDQKVCRKLAREEIDQNNFGYDFYARNKFYVYDPFYRDKNYRPHLYKNNHDRFFQRQKDFKRFFRICMKAKGWQKVRVESE